MIARQIFSVLLIGRDDLERERWDEVEDLK